MYRYLSVQVADYQFCMVGYALDNTLTDYGSVNRGICSIRDGDLTLIPYYAWNHRGPGKMEVWLHEK